MTSDASVLTDCAPSPSHFRITTADGSPLPVSSSGSLILTSDPSRRFFVPDV